MSDDKFTYEDGDLESVKDGDGPTIEDLLKHNSEEEVDQSGDFGKPDPGFRAPDFREKKD